MLKIRIVVAPDGQLCTEPCFDVRVMAGSRDELVDQFAEMPGSVALEGYRVDDTIQWRGARWFHWRQFVPALVFHRLNHVRERLERRKFFRVAGPAMRRSIGR